MISDFFKRYNLPSYRLKQFNQAYFRDLVTSFNEITTWPLEIREKLKREVLFSSIIPLKSISSPDKKTIKVLFERISDKKQFESVLMIHEDERHTVCVSSMIGCPAGCLFCATGKMGFQGNLSSSEIVDQVLYFMRILKKERKTVSNIVFMGMGEPLLNLEAVLSAIKVFTDPEYLGMSDRRIAVSTCGIIPELKRLIESGFRGRLILSLHAPNQELREELMPIAKSNPLGELIKILKDYSLKNNKRINFEYILIDKVNDSIKDARDLAELIGRKLTYVNLIPFNEVKGVSFKKSKLERVKEFSKLLTKIGIGHTVRVTMGDEIKAACGQLAIN